MELFVSFVRHGTPLPRVKKAKRATIRATIKIRKSRCEPTKPPTSAKISSTRAINSSRENTSTSELAFNVHLTRCQMITNIPTVNAWTRSTARITNSGYIQEEGSSRLGTSTGK